MARTWIEDTWHTNSGTRSSTYGQGSRWKAYWHEDAQENGRRLKRRRSKRFRTKSTAAAFLQEIDRTQHDGTYRTREQRSITFGEAAEEWLATRHGIKDSTHRRYRRELDNYCLPKWGGHSLDSITRRALLAWITELRDGTAPAAYRRRGATDRALIPGTMNRPLSAKGIKQVTQVVRAVLQWAVDSEILATNPAARLTVPRSTPPEQIYLTHDQVEALAQSAEDATGRHDDAILVNLLAYTGVRINEALALQVRAVDLSSRRIRISQAWTSNKAGTLVMGSPKSGKPREVPIPRFLVADLTTITSGRDADEYLFTAARGGPVLDHNWRARVFNPARAGAEVPSALTPHKLRHTAASMAIAAGADVKVVQQMLGHADASETLNTYAHLWPDKLDTIANALDAARSASLAQTGTARRDAINCD